MRIPLILALSTALVLAACATSTPYQQAAGPNGRGFSEYQIEKNRFRVSFAGNSLTDRNTVENYLLYRAAELTTQRGFDHFIISERATDKKERTVGSSRYRGHHYIGWSYFHPAYGWIYEYGYNDPFYYDDFDLHQITRFEAGAEISMGLGPKPTDNDRAYDARDVMKNLAGSIQRPEL